MNQGCVGNFAIDPADTKVKLSYANTSYILPIGQFFSSGSPDLGTKDKLNSCYISPALPAGLSIDETTCEISGQTSLIFSQDFNVTASTSTSSDTISINLTSLQVVPSVSFLSNPFIFNLFEFASTGLPLNSGGQIVTCSINPNLPLGLSLNTSTCEISGTPILVTNSNEYAITATNEAGDSATYNMTIGVDNIVPDIAFSVSSFQFNLNDSSSATLTPTNTGGGITSCLVSPPLPAGLSISQSTCRISGTPNAVSPLASYTLVPANNMGEGPSIDIEIEVKNIAPAINYSSGSYAFSLKASSSTTDTPVNTGGAITSCSITPELPTGLGISMSTCRIYGNPTVVSNPTTYTITAVNEVGSSDQISIDLAVRNVAPSITFSLDSYEFKLFSPGSTTGEPINSGGAITNCTILPNLPDGLSLDATTCIISGTPTAVTSARNYTITPSNAIGAGASKVIHLAVQNIVPNISYLNQSYNFSLFSSLSSTDRPINFGGEIIGCSISPALPAGLILDTTTCKISGTPRVLLPSTSFEVSATNEIGYGAAVTINLIVSNVVPSLTFSSSSYSFNLFDSEAKTQAPGNSGGAITNCSVTPSLPAGLALDRFSCEISGRPTSVSAATNYRVIASNAVGAAEPQQVTIAVANIPPSLSYTITDYHFTLLNVSTGVAPPQNTGGNIETCSITPTLPNGLSFNPSTCEISGTPTVVSSSSVYTITASNEVGSGSAKTISISVTNIVPNIAFSNSNYSFNLFGLGSSTGTPTNSGGEISGCAVSPALPNGLSINSTNCKIEGTPLIISSPTSYTVTPFNEIGSGTPKLITITVANVLPSITFSTTSYSFNLFGLGSSTGTPTNSGGAITGCVVSPELPNGLSINSTNCAIEGTPLVTSNSVSYTVTPYNEMGSGASQVVEITVANVLPSITFSKTSFSFNLYEAGVTTGAPTNSGGALIGCSVSPALPAGLSINNFTCEIFGTPTSVSASTNYTVTPSSSIGEGTPQIINVTVLTILPAITYASDSFSFNLYSSGVTTAAPANAGGDITNCLVSPALPTGLSISNTTCEISGTPTAVSGLTVYTVTASNEIGAAIAKTVSITVNNIVPSIAFANTNNIFKLFTAGLASGIPTNSGGAITGCMISPALPAGLSISNINCEISGTPTVVSSSKNYTVTPSNAIGTGTPRVISITVSTIIPAITYASDSFSFNLYSSGVTTAAPANAGGDITNCLVSPALPTGLSISNTTCEISGTPTAVSALTAYTVIASNEIGDAISKTVSITVSNIIPNIAFSTSNYSFNLFGLGSSTETPTNSGGAISGCTVSPALPNGLLINSTTCRIEGTPLVTSNSTSYTLTPYNEMGSGNPQVISLTVANILPSISYSTTSYSFNLYATGATTGVPANSGGALTSCSITPPLPAGLSISNTTCEISGTPTVVSTSRSYTVTPSSTIGEGTPQVISLTILTIVPSISYGSNAYSFSINSSGATTGTPTNSGGALTNCLVSPALPPGLSILIGTCKILGTPTVVTASADYTITPVNSAGSGTPVVLSITIPNAAPAITYSSSSYGLGVKTPNSTTGIPSNAGGDITNCSVSPTLPTGLSISSTTCEISGTPTTITTAANYTITPSGSAGTGTAKVIFLGVANSVPGISYSSSSYSFEKSTAATTGTPTYTGGAITGCTISPGLPSGMTINATTCVISGTATSGRTKAAYTITPKNAVGNGSAVTISMIFYNNSVVPGQQSYSATSFVLLRDHPINLIATGAHTTGMPTSCSSVPALPTGLSFTSLCAITGTPTVTSGSTNYAITASNSTGSGPSKNLALTVVYAPRITYSSSSYAFNLNASGSTTGVPTNSGNTITGCTISPALPSGLTLNTTNCQISGTPNTVAASTNYTVTPKNGTVSGNPVTVNLTVNNIVPQNLSYGTGITFTFYAGVYGQTGYPTSSGGGITACSSYPALPQGLSFNSECNLGGTPVTASPSTNYTITPSNSAGSGTPKVIILEVRDTVPGLSYEKASYSFIRYSDSLMTPTLTGGSLTSCSIQPPLPQGLTLNPSCGISGSPEVQSEMTSYTITPSNSMGDGTPQVVSIEVLPLFAYNGNYSNLTFNFLLNVSGQTSGEITTSYLEYCSISPALPEGLSLSRQCEISGTPKSLSGSSKYEISANDTSGYSDSFTISISVVENLKPNINYLKSSYNVALEAIEIPANTGGRSTGCRITWVGGAPSSQPNVSSQCQIMDFYPDPGYANCNATPSEFEVTPSNSAGDGEPVRIELIYDDLGGC